MNDKNNIFIILLPEALNSGVVGSILSDIEYNGFKIVKTLYKNKSDVIHEKLKLKPYYKDIIKGAFVVCHLFKENAIEDFSKIVGDKLQENSLLGDYCKSPVNDIIYFSKDFEINNVELKYWL